MTDEELFLAARTAVDRTALERYKRAEDVDEDDELQKRVAESRFRQLPLLLTPELHAYALNIATCSRGAKITGDTKFPATIWVYGATQIKKGINFDRSFYDFTRLLSERAREVALKAQGWVIEPTTTIDGRRTNASTTAVHALFLDCDGSGEWHKLLDVLAQLDYAFVAYQSGGYKPATPKWRIVLPLAAPFDTASDEKRAIWKNVYHHSRVIFGTLAELHGEGFDSKTDTPAIPWFLTEKRTAEDPPRQIVARAGHSLDLMALTLALPAIEEIQPPIRTLRGEIKSTGLSDEKLDELINGLSHVTAAIPSGRHELYLAIPGVLLDRGVPSDEVLAVIEAVSANYPRKHPDKHRDNIHNAKTTITKWESGAPVTRIGTLNERWPEIAQVIDRVLPDPLSSLIAETTAQMLGIEIGQMTSNSEQQSSIPTPKKKHRNYSVFGESLSNIVRKQIAPLVGEWRKTEGKKEKSRADLLDRILNNDPIQTTGIEQQALDETVNNLVFELGCRLPTVQWLDILDLISRSLLSFAQSTERVDAAKVAYTRGQDRWHWQDRKNKTKINNFRETAAADLARAQQVIKGR